MCVQLVSPQQQELGQTSVLTNSSQAEEAAAGVCVCVCVIHVEEQQAENRAAHWLHFMFD